MDSVFDFNTHGVLFEELGNSIATRFFMVMIGNPMQLS